MIYRLFAIIILMFNALLVTSALYLAVLVLAAWRNPRRKDLFSVKPPRSQSPMSFIILIPAHDEEMMIAETIRRVNALNYPHDKFELVVIADNCDDDTAKICRDSQCFILERRDRQNPGKGQALNWAMTNHLAAWPRHFDAVLVLDADSFLSPNALWFFSQSLQQGNKVAQGYYTVSNPRESWRTSLMTAALALVHFARPLGRDQLGLPCGIKGNGFVINRRLVMDYGYPASSNVEDLEVTLFYRLQGVKPAFVPGAQIYGHMTSHSDAAVKQRSRWEGGRVTMVRRWTGNLLITAWQKRDVTCVDAVFELCIPPFAVLAGVTFLSIVLTLVAATLRSTAIILAATGMSFSAGALESLYALSGIKLINPDACVWRRLLFAPIYIFWKLILYMQMFTRPGIRKQWERTDRH